jgi:hypothetical protein
MITDEEVAAGAEKFLRGVGAWPPKNNDDWTIACASYRLGCRWCGCSAEIHWRGKDSPMTCSYHGPVVGPACPGYEPRDPNFPRSDNWPDRLYDE